MIDRELTLRIRADVAAAYRGLRRLGDGLGHVRRAARQAREALRRAGVAMRRWALWTTAIVGAGLGINRLSKAVFAQERALARVDARIRSLGAATKLTTPGLARMAAQLQDVTTFGDEATLEMQSLLLTFRSIAGQSPALFRRVTEAVQDLAAAMDIDLRSAALQLAKALEDPERGLTALSRSGTTFTESQKDQIRALVESGDRAQAMVRILEVLEGQVQGTARAIRDTLGGAVDAAKNAFGDLFEAQADDTRELREAIEDLVVFLQDPKTKAAARDLAAGLAWGIKAALEALRDISKWAAENPRLAGAIFGGYAGMRVGGIAGPKGAAAGGLIGAAAGAFFGGDIFGAGSAVQIRERQRQELQRRLSGVRAEMERIKEEAKEIDSRIRQPGTEHLLEAYRGRIVALADNMKNLRAELGTINGELRDLDALDAADELEEIANLQTGDGLRVDMTRGRKPGPFSPSAADADKRGKERRLTLLEEYAAEAQDLQAGIEDATLSSLRSMEDALADFAVRGKIEFRNLANSIISDLARIAVRQHITGPLAAGLQGAIGSLFGGPGGRQGPLGFGDFGVQHAGGVVGAPGGVRRRLPLESVAAQYLAGRMPRYHAGGIVGADERVIVAQVGERILPKGASPAGASVSINLNNETSRPIEAQPGPIRFDGDRYVADVVLRDLRDGGPISRQLHGAGVLA